MRSGEGEGGGGEGEGGFWRIVGVSGVTKGGSIVANRVKMEAYKLTTMRGRSLQYHRALRRGGGDQAWGIIK